MIPDIFLDRQLISLVARVAAFIMHFFLGGANTAPTSRRAETFRIHRKLERVRKIRDERSKKLAGGEGRGIMCTLKRKLKLRGSLLNRCKRPVNGGI